MLNAILNRTLPDETYEGADEVLQLVSFWLGPEEYAIDILSVQEIIRMVAITHVPNSPHYVQGVINLRGKIIPIVCLRSRLGLVAEKPTKDTRIVVVEMGRLTLGFIVDSVDEVLRLPEEFIEPHPSAGEGRADDFHKGIGRLEGRLLILLNFETLLGFEAVG